MINPASIAIVLGSVLYSCTEWVDTWSVWRKLVL